jgi:hypothetical protein
MTIRVVTLKSQFIRANAPQILAAAIAQYDWWRIGDDGLQKAAAIACDLAEALYHEIERRNATEVLDADAIERAAGRKGEDKQ